MGDVNWWLMALAFVLGLLLTFAMMIRKVTREVPVTHTVSAAATAAGAAAAGGAAAKVRGVAEKVHGDVRGVAEKVHGDVHAAAEKVHGDVRGAAEKVHGDVRGAAEKVHGDLHAAAEKVHGDVRGAAEKVHGDVHAAAEKVHDDVHTLAQKVDTVESRGIIEVAPYGSGSIRVTRRRNAPAGYRIKGAEKTRRYHTSESPDFDAIETELWFLNEESAGKAGFLRWDAKGDDKVGLVEGAGTGAVAAHFASVDDVPAGPYGRGSAKADVDGSGPAGWTIKGNADSMLYHTTDSQWYGQTIAEVWFADEESARAAGFLRWDTDSAAGARAAVASIEEVPAGPYGKGSANSGAGGSGPRGWLIKGNADSMLFHGPDSPAYEQTIAEVWFFDEATARAAGFDKWDKNFK